MWPELCYVFVQLFPYRKIFRIYMRESTTNLSLCSASSPASFQDRSLLQAWFKSIFHVRNSSRPHRAWCSPRELSLSLLRAVCFTLPFPGRGRHSPFPSCTFSAPRCGFLSQRKKAEMTEFLASCCSAVSLEQL